MNGFEQIKSFYSWVFNNPDKIRPTHISLYLFLWNQANRANWAEWIKCPYDLAMQGACIGNNGTYYKCLDELQKFGLIEYKKGINNFKAPLVKLIRLYDCEQLTEQVTVPLSEQQTAQQYEQQPEQLPVHIYKLITNNIKQITNNYKKFEKFILELNNVKIDKSVIDNIYSLYPTKCSVRNASNGKCEKNKEQIKKLLATHSEAELKTIIENYIKNCTATKTYMKNFSTFLNNLPIDLLNSIPETDKPQQKEKVFISGVEVVGYKDDGKPIFKFPG